MEREIICSYKHERTEDPPPMGGAAATDGSKLMRVRFLHLVWKKLIASTVKKQALNTALLRYILRFTSSTKALEQEWWEPSKLGFNLKKFLNIKALESKNFDSGNGE
ncbi:Uncharacterized protein Fot_16506 [Forsythia ovata]|uniref:Uncharacterized protein n=1 Tax=Forsythia ovata TaxID=205694 RepID=A0ABD1WC82_9LAMI